LIVQRLKVLNDPSSDIHSWWWSSS
jgi:hypothetical protein